MLTSEEAVRRATGRGRPAWFAVLDDWGAAKRTHRDIAAWLMSKHGIDNWWSQTLTVDYEHARGLRPVGGARDGTFAVNASKTVSVPVRRLVEAFVNARLRNRWLKGAAMKLRTSRRGRTARFAWEDGSTRVYVGFTAKGPGKSQAGLCHERLPDARAAKRMKAYWRERLEALKALLER